LRERHHFRSLLPISDPRSRRSVSLADVRFFNRPIKVKRLSIGTVSMSLARWGALPPQPARSLVQVLAVLTISANVTRNPINTIISMSVTITRMLITGSCDIATSSPSFPSATQ
jgi:hypothetical protein